MATNFCWLERGRLSGRRLLKGERTSGAHVLGRQMSGGRCPGVDSRGGESSDTRRRQAKDADKSIFAERRCFPRGGRRQQ